MPEFRYAQVCPMARTAELLGERWTLLILRELWVGPQRFSDLRRRLPGISSSVLATRLARLEQRGLAQVTALDAPVRAYALGEAGHALKPALRELMLWGIRFMGAVRPGDHIEPSWALVGLELLARSAPTPALRVEVRIPDQEREWIAELRGGRAGTRIERAASGRAQLVVRSEALAIVGVACGAMAAAEPLERGTLRVLAGDPALLDKLPALFDRVPDPVQPVS